MGEEWFQEAFAVHSIDSTGRKKDLFFLAIEAACGVSAVQWGGIYFMNVLCTFCFRLKTLGVRALIKSARSVSSVLHRSLSGDALFFF